MSEVFEDVTANGKVRPWKERKIENVRYAEYLSILEFKRAHDIKNCGETLRFRKIGDHVIVSCQHCNASQASRTEALTLQQTVRTLQRPMAWNCRALEPWGRGARELRGRP